MKHVAEIPKWVTFYPTFNNRLILEGGDPLDERIRVCTSVTQLAVLVCLPFLVMQSWWFLFLFPFLFLGWGTLLIYLPIETPAQDLGSASYGFSYHTDMVWIHIGGRAGNDVGERWITIEMPWALKWVRTSTEMKRGDWHHKTESIEGRSGTEGKPGFMGSNEWVEANKGEYSYLFRDKSDNTSVNATISVYEMEWRPLWFKWTSLFAKKKRFAEVRFSQPVGEDKHLPDGGISGCTREMNPDETPFQCLTRIQAEGL